LEYIYCDQVHLDEQSATELLRITDKYNVPALKELCEEILGECLTTTNAVELGMLADKTDAKQLIKSVVKFVKKNLIAVSEHDDIRRLPKSVVIDICMQKID